MTHTVYTRLATFGGQNTSIRGQIMQLDLFRSDEYVTPAQIRAARGVLRLSQSQLATLAAIDASSIKRAENLDKPAASGRGVTVATLKKIGDTLITILAENGYILYKGGIIPADRVEQ